MEWFIPDKGSYNEHTITIYKSKKSSKICINVKVYNEYVSGDNFARLGFNKENQTVTMQLSKSH